jgi:hypothetical protein
VGRGEKVAKPLRLRPPPRITVSFYDAPNIQV